MCKSFIRAKALHIFAVPHLRMRFCAFCREAIQSDHPPGVRLRPYDARERPITRIRKNTSMVGRAARNAALPSP